RGTVRCGRGEQLRAGGGPVRCARHGDLAHPAHPVRRPAREAPAAGAGARRQGGPEDALPDGDLHLPQPVDRASRPRRAAGPASVRRHLMRRGSRGQSVAEMAVALPFLVLLFCGLLDLGRAYYSLVTVTDAARDGARMLVTSSSGVGPGSAAGCTAVQVAVVD